MRTIAAVTGFAGIREPTPAIVVERYDADHFTVYHPPVVERVVADQIEFLSTHLAPKA
ncbi:hypothetical protein ACW9HJ_25410 [Nocardia gipuzkoensis]